MNNFTLNVKITSTLVRALTSEAVGRNCEARQICSFLFFLKEGAGWEKSELNVNVCERGANTVAVM